MEDLEKIILLNPWHLGNSDDLTEELITDYRNKSVAVDKMGQHLACRRLDPKRKKKRRTQKQARRLNRR